MNDWELENVEEQAKEFPDTFFIPSIQERKSQKVGDLVKLYFLLKETGPDLPRAERMWVEISAAYNNGESYHGYLTNQPKYIKGLKLGDEITFDITNIAEVIVKETDPNWVACGELKALVSKKCFEKGEIVRFLYRESPDREEDSGWRLLSGHETDEETNDPDSIRICNVYWLLNWDPTLLEAVKTGGYGDVFERQEKEDSWQIVKDWNPEE